MERNKPAEVLMAVSLVGLLVFLLSLAFHASANWLLVEGGILFITFSVADALLLPYLLDFLSDAMRRF